jgi:hypothetical protein
MTMAFIAELKHFGNVSFVTKNGLLMTEITPPHKVKVRVSCELILENICITLFIDQSLLCQHKQRRSCMLVGHISSF